MHKTPAMVTLKVAEIDRNIYGFYSSIADIIPLGFVILKLGVYIIGLELKVYIVNQQFQ